MSSKLSLQFGFTASLCVCSLLGCPPVHAPGDTQTIYLPSDVPLEMIWVGPGIFVMGNPTDDYPVEEDEVPQRNVRISSGFWMGKYELTKVQWTAVMGTTPWLERDYVSDDPDSPAVYLSWEDVQSFIAELNTLTGLDFRMPTEAEWEYTCRAGTQSRYYWGDDPELEIGIEYAWHYSIYDTGGLDRDNDYAEIVGLKLPNAWGFYDMSGNAWEWCSDWYGRYRDTNGSTDFDPTGPTCGSHRIARGGSFFDQLQRCRSANRGFELPSYKDETTGFRLCR